MDRRKASFLGVILDFLMCGRHVPVVCCSRRAVSCYETRKVMPMTRRLPPLNALRAFEAAARNENLSRAATELGVTQAAVSQHVKSLEATLGPILFAGSGKRLDDSGAGREA